MVRSIQNCCLSSSSQWKKPEAEKQKEHMLYLNGMGNFSLSHKKQKHIKVWLKYWSPLSVYNLVFMLSVWYHGNTQLIAVDKSMSGKRPKVRSDVFPTRQIKSNWLAFAMENMKLLIHFLPPGVPSFLQDTEFIDVKPFLNYELKRPLDFRSSQ